MEDYKQLTDKELDEAILELIPSLEKRASVFTKNKEEANDLFQETFYKIWANKHMFTYNESLKAWCFKIMYNTLVDMFKEAKKVTPLEAGEYDEDSLNAPEHNNLLKDYNNAESSISLEDILTTIDDTLSPTDSLIVKRLLSGYKQAEVAKELGLTTNNVKQHYFQAIRKLRPILSEKFNLDERYGINKGLVPVHKDYRRRKLQKDIQYRKKFEI